MQENVSIIIPCYNEYNRLPVKELDESIEGLDKKFHIVFVNDGSSDNTISLLEAIKVKFNSKVSIVDLNINVGKAEAIRKGVEFVIANLNSVSIAYLDADLATPVSAIVKLDSIMLNNNEIFFVLGSRIQRMGSNIKRNPGRHYLGRVFATVASIILQLPVYDTQCGGKLMKIEIAKVVFAEKFISRWLFDVEILARCITNFGYQKVMNGVYEFPLDTWREIGGSKIKIKDFLNVPVEFAKIYAKYYRRISCSKLIK